MATAGDGAQIWYEVLERESAGTPLLLIQGLGMDHHGWDDALADFDGRSLILVDHRGTGGSEDRFGDEWSTRDFAADVAAVLDRLGGGRVHVYGHSMGGRIAQWLAADRPDLVAALVLGGTRVGDRAAFPWPAESEAALRSADPARLAELNYPPAWVAEHPEEAARVMTATRSAAALRTHMRASSTYDGPAPSAIAAPTLVVHGADDRLAVLDNGRLLAEEIPVAELLVLEGARHAYWVGRPDAHAAVRAFLARHDAGERSPASNDRNQ